MALEDANIENGGMWFVPGSHNDYSFSTHYVAKEVEGEDGKKKKKLTMEGGEWPLNIADDKFVPCEVKRGTCVLIHGGVIHRSGVNRSDKCRPVATVHIIETADGVQWSKLNWNQPEVPFDIIYDDTEQ